MDRDDERGDGDIRGLPSLSVEGAAVQLDRAGLSWGAGANITFAFRDTAPGAMPDDTAGFSRFNTAQINQALLAMQSWSDLANVTFTRVGGSGYSNDAAILFGNYSSGAEGAAAFANLPGSTASANEAGDAWFNSSLSYNSAPANLNYGRMTLTHEIGHTLGLLHPGDYDASDDGEIIYPDDAEYYEDSLQYSVMSYFESGNTGSSHGEAYPAAPMLDDIAAIQLLYGANMSTRTGDTIYGYNSNTGRDFYSLADGASVAVFAIWDAGGYDTLDGSAASSAQYLDLRQGHFSNFAGLIANVSIAPGAVIERALGGSGSDTMYATDAFGTADQADIAKARGDDNHKRSTAISLDGGFDTVFDTNIISSTTIPHATVRGIGGGGVDYYAISATVGDTVTFDIDGTPGLTGSQAYDAFLYVIGSNGSVLAQNDDGPRDSGSSVRQDSLLTYTFTTTGVFYIAVTNFEKTGIPAGVPYVLNVSHEGAAVTVTSRTGSTLEGGAGGDWLYGGDGNDILIGGADADTMEGGKGDDIYYADDGDVIYEADYDGDDGYDIIYSSGSMSVGRDIEELILTGTADLYGAGAFRIVGNAGDNFLQGEVMEGGRGNDTYVFGSAGQTIIETSNGGTDSVETYVNLTLLDNLENMTMNFYGGAINGTGNALANVMSGNTSTNVLDGKAGDDTLSGGDGDDTLIGGSGADRLSGEAGADTLIGGAGNDYYMIDASDIVVETAGEGEGVDTVGSAIRYVLGANLENLTLTGSRTINGAGNSLANVLTGNAANNLLDGKAGADTMQGREGDDTYIVDNVGDVVIENSFRWGSDTVKSSVTFTLGANVETLILTGTAKISGAGNSGDNLIVGNNGINRLAGRGGADVFDFNATAQSTASAYDTIIDLSNDDRIDLSTIDANVNRSGNQGFTMVDRFTKTAGQMTMKFYADLGITSILMDVNGDGKADMKIVLTGDHHDFTNFAF